MLFSICKGENTMDMDRFYKMLMEDDRIKDLPITIVLKITLIVLDIINSGDCIYKVERNI